MLKGRVSIPCSDWPSLRDLFLIEWPKHIVPYSLLQNYINWAKQDPAYVRTNVEIYCLDADWMDGTFYLVVSYEREHENIYLFTFEQHTFTGRLISVLSHINRESHKTGKAIVVT